MEDHKYLSCPWCGEDDFDLFGLKIHLARGWCDAFNECAEFVPPADNGEDGQ